MLRFLSVQDFVIVDQMELNFVPGFTVLTGETGAGKSILIDALSLVLGKRGDATEVRDGCDRAEINAEFDVSELPELLDWLQENDLENEDDSKSTCLMRRVIEINGRSRGFINGRLVTLQQLRAAGEKLVDIHGQHEHQSLLRSETQRDLLDNFSGSCELVKKVSTAYLRWQNLHQQRIIWEKNVAVFMKEKEQLEWQAHELATLNFSLDEWQVLQNDHSRLSHVVGLVEAVQVSIETISEGEFTSLTQVNSVISRLRNVLDFDTDLRTIIDLLESAQIQLQEATYELSRYQQRLDVDPKKFQEVEDRLTAIYAISRKYHVAPGELPSVLNVVNEKLEIFSRNGNSEEIAKEEREALDEYLKFSQALSAVREKSAKDLSRQVTSVMQTLAMAGDFSVMLTPLKSGNVHGIEQIEFQISTHQGAPLRALVKVASGGELSRISLAIQVITSKISKASTLIFDEVDVGIGGRIAEIVGGLLKKLGTERQVMCVTHLAQVASAGDQQWQVIKLNDLTKDGTVLSRINMLSTKERIEEIARMLGGKEITETTRKHAAEMLRMSGRL